MRRWYFQWVYSLMQTGGSPVHVLSDRQLTALFPYRVKPFLHLKVALVPFLRYFTGFPLKLVNRGQFRPGALLTEIIFAIVTPALDLKYFFEERDF